MNKIILTALLITTGQPFFAQAQTIIIGESEFKIKNPQTLAGKVFYNFTYLKDTTQPQYLYKEMMELDFGKSKSLFFSRSKKISDSTMAEDVMKQVQTAQDPNHIDLTIRGSSFISSDMFYTDDSLAETYSLKPLSSALFYIKDTQPKIDWKILDSTKKIGNYLCQKAEGESHGRTNTAWFCNDLPYNFGPRKISGLPGLILEAYDKKKEIVYTFNRIIIPSPGETGLPEDAIHASNEEFNKAKEAFMKNPSAFSQSHPSRGTPIQSPLNKLDASKIKSMSVIKETPYGKDVRLKDNNPIDLK